jgi:ABC-2 type transport system ATP-binding protein
MINLKNVHFGYHAADDLFKNITLTLEANSICGLLGKNGAGKTTLLKIMAGLIFPTTGTAAFKMIEVAKRLPHVLEDIYFVPEECYLPELSAKDYLKLYAPFYTRFDHALFERCESEFGISHDKLLTHLSYGQRKKFLISFALATHAKLILFDEPTNGLDIPSKSQFRQLIAANMTDDKLFIISTHQVHDVENLVDRVVMLDDGEIILNASITQIARSISFHQQQNEPTPGDCLYLEKTINGYSVIVKNTTQGETHVDLELFFNMAMTQKQNTKLLFGEKGACK